LRGFGNVRFRQSRERRTLLLPQVKQFFCVRTKLFEEGIKAMRLASAIKALAVLRHFMVLAMACAGASTVYAADAGTVAALALRTKFESLQQQLARNQFQRPLFLVSSDTANSVTGDIYAVVSMPFATAGAALSSPARWCDILMLHINTKYCRASSASGGSVLQVNIGKKRDQPVNEAYRLDFAYRVASETAGYMKVMLTAETGPLSTRDYRIGFEAMPLDNGGTFIHLTYSYRYGLAGQLAMQTYLATIGLGKVGFTVVGTQSSGSPRYIGGMRGVAERNTMRYYLAIEAFLGNLSAPPQTRLEQSLRDWFAAIERYPRQLHELEQNEYLDMKRREHLRL
jgi:hypothetical protein